MDGSSGVRSGALRAPKPFRIDFERLSVNGRLARGGIEEPHAGRILRVLVGSGRGCVLQGNAALPMVLVPLRGGVRVADGESARILLPGQLAVVEAGQGLQVVSSGLALWIAFVAPVPVWRHLLDATSETPIPEPLLLPTVHVADRAIRRAALRVAREARRSSEGSLESVPALLRLAALLAHLQSSFDPLIKRCPGRSLAQRRGVFLRLQRVHNSMVTNSARGLCIGDLARVANYSPCHFVRTFNTVYEVTPHAVLNEQRLQRAHRLVYETRLSITEVARASGFEDRCAFARSFKQRFGVTATATRRDALGTMAT